MTESTLESLKKLPKESLTSDEQRVLENLAATAEVHQVVAELRERLRAALLHPLATVQVYQDEESRGDYILRVARDIVDEEGGKPPISVWSSRRISRSSASAVLGDVDGDAYAGKFTDRLNITRRFGDIEGTNARGQLQHELGTFDTKYELTTTFERDGRRFSAWVDLPGENYGLPDINPRVETLLPSGYSISPAVFNGPADYAGFLSLFMRRLPATPSPQETA
ncbi:hypothetical protein HY612_01605 [Candidatus Roizmanbacteria bacterium]|nr:hypothetical protein [Candidatus Roizmanbacteria bacterium]